MGMNSNISIFHWFNRCVIFRISECFLKNIDISIKMSFICYDSRWAFDVADQVSHYSRFGLAEHQMLLSDVK